MTYEVWIQNIERDSDMEKEREYYERDLVTEDSDEAKERVDFEREELFGDSGQSSNIGLGQSESERLSETGISEGAHRRDELLSNSVVEAESPMREQGSPVLNGAIAE